jgi:Rieske Fe-S protein
MSVPVLSRRGALRGSVVTVIGGLAGFLAGRTSSAARTPRGTTAANAYGAAPGAGGRLLLPLDRIPKGGGVVLRQDSLVLTRSATDEVHGFSAVCTHQGCTDAKEAAGTIDCPCHGSRYDALTGAVRAGPAPRPLPPVAVVVRAGNVYSS